MFDIRLALKLHPDSACEAVTGIEVEVGRSRRGTLELHYVVTGAIADLRIPPITPSVRSDGLWQHTCFEAFVRAGSGEGYDEFNFAPSGQWAAYRFSSYREGMQPLEIDPPQIEARSATDRYELCTAVDLTGPCTLALSAVIEEANGRKSYWALAHPAGKADFHHPDSFVHELP